MPLSPLLAAYEHVLLDLDGCVWVSGELTPGAGDALAQLRDAGKAIAFVTNDAARAPEDYVRSLWACGCKASVHEVVTVGAAIQFLLAERAERAGPADVYVVGSPALHRHVADAGQRVVNHTPRAAGAAIVVVAAHEDLTYDELRIATRALVAGAELVAAGNDRTFPAAGGASPGTGMLVAGLQYATGVSARIAGKPDRLIFQAALDRLGPGRALMIGDRIDSDLAGADAAGIDGALVLSGVTDRDEAQAARDPAPVAIADTLAELVTVR